MMSTKNNIEQAKPVYCTDDSMVDSILAYFVIIVRVNGGVFGIYIEHAMFTCLSMLLPCDVFI